jgi:cysteine peptidase B
MKVVLFAILCLVALCSAKNWQLEFDNYVRDFNKVYSTPEEHRLRMVYFVSNMIEAEKLNKLNPRARFGPTKFSDLSKKEFAGSYLTAQPIPKSEMPAPKNFSVKAKPHERFASGRLQGPDPTNYDWSSAGVITPVYNQGQCGSCWAFSATETIESYYALAGGQLTQLSMEQIVDCDTSDSGCNGGFPSSAYQYVQSAGGIDSYSSYPYTAGGGQAGYCQFSSSNVVTDVSSASSISGESGEYSQLSSSSGGPVSVCVDASSWQNYQGGVLTSCGDQVDHCVQLTGYYNYGSSNAYWNVRNSWAADWGENGYIWIAIGQDLCAIGDYATIVADTN